MSGDARIRGWLLVSTDAVDEEASSRLNGSRPQVQPFSCLMKTGNKGKRRSERANGWSGEPGKRVWSRVGSYEGRECETTDERASDVVEMRTRC